MAQGPKARASRKLGMTGLQILDREHLAQYTMGDPQLAAEIVGLFLTQMPATLALLRSAANPREWRLAAHTLKGSAMAVGAMRIARIAEDLEHCGGLRSKVRQQLLAALDGEVAAVREAGQNE
jgi:HPt (histidine-containing phosphotransfer) domain-containing protein